MWSISVRCGLENDDGAVMRAMIQKTLWQARLSGSPSGAWESVAASPDQAARAIGEVLRTLANPGQVSGVAPGFRLSQLQIEIRPAQLNPRLAETVDWNVG